MAVYKDYIPEAQNAFNGWQQQFIKVAKQKATAWNLPAEEVKKLTTLQKEFEDLHSIANKEAAAKRTRVELTALNTSRATYEAALRVFIKGFVRSNPLIDNTGKTALSVTVPDVIRTRRGTPLTVPAVSTVPARGAAINVHITQQPGKDGSSRRGKPRDAARIEVAAFVGAQPPVNPDTISMKSQYGRSPVLLCFDTDLCGSMVYIYCRFIGFNHKPGPWSKESRQIVPL